MSAMLSAVVETAIYAASWKVLAGGTFQLLATPQLVIDAALERLRSQGSVAAPGFMNPEGVVVFHAASRSLYKVTLERDHEPKGCAA